MGTFFRLLLTAAIVFNLFSGSARAYEEEVTTNQLRAEEYILQLKTGKDPATVERPEMKRAKTWEAKHKRREMINAMDRAEELAREGKSNLIEDPSRTFEKKPEESPKKKSKGY